VITAGRFWVFTEAIGVSEFFETELGTPVSDKSLHGAFLKRHFSGYTESIDNQLAAELKNEEPTEVADKACGKNLCYSIGTTAVVRVNEERYLLFALSKTNHENCASSGKFVGDLTSQSGLWLRKR
jgi:hypothetical protein